MHCDVAILTALSIESGGLVDRLSAVTVMRADGFTVRQGRLGRREVVVVESGPGRPAAAKATHAVIDAYRPRWIVSSGFAGALDPALKRGDLVAASAIVDGEGSAWTADAALPPWLTEVPRLHVGRWLTADRVLRTPEEKQAAAGAHQAIAVDMESLAVAEVCCQRKVPFLALRVIGDEAADSLPPDIEWLLRQKSLAGQLGAALGSIWRRPESFGELLGLRQKAMEDSQRLGGVLAEMVERLQLSQADGLGWMT